MSSAEKMLERSSPFRSLETSGSSVYPRMPRSGPAAASLKTPFTSSFVTSRPTCAVKSTTETVLTGTRKDMPVNRPLSSGMTRPIARAAPVSLGTMFIAAARASRGSFATTSRSRCEFV